MNLRPYQQTAINQLYHWFAAHPAGHPCLVMPTGSGKSHVIAALCQDVIRRRPAARILVLAHVRELLEQNADKILKHWPGATMGIYSAGLGSRDIKQITVAGIQSVYKRAEELGFITLCIVDESHLVNADDAGMYRTLISALSINNPRLRVIGLTATPYRLGHGLITDPPAIFDALIEPVSIMELIDGGFLAPLRSKHTETTLDISGVSIRGGEYVEQELQAAVDRPEINAGVVADIIRRGVDRKSWLIFCAGVDHANNIAVELIQQGIEADVITGETDSDHRAQLIAAYKSGRMRALTNANVLTTGFDAPDTDMIVFLRPTQSPGLYCQMAGRGMRVKAQGGDCMVLDYAGNVGRHGPITDIVIPDKKGKGSGDPITKNCPFCGEIVGISCRTCPACGATFPPPEKAPNDILYQDDIMRRETQVRDVHDWTWRVHTKKTTGQQMLRVSYYFEHGFDSIDEYLTVLHPGFAGEKGRRLFAEICQKTGYNPPNDDAPDMYAVAKALDLKPPPAKIYYKMDGKYPRIVRKIWEVIK